MRGWHRLRIGRLRLSWQRRPGGPYRLARKRVDYGTRSVTTLKVGSVVATWYVGPRWRPLP